MSSVWQDLREYYRTVGPFYAAEMAEKGDLPAWRALVRVTRPARVLDLGCGGGRLGAALLRDDPRLAVIGVDLLDILFAGPSPIPFVRADMRALPFGPTFDLVAAANDPFAHLLADAERERALREARRVLRRGGRVAIDGLWDPPPERVRRLADGTRLVETWSRLGDGLYDARYAYTRDGRTTTASTRLRAWTRDEPALAAVGAEMEGALVIVPAR